MGCLPSNFAKQPNADNVFINAVSEATLILIARCVLELWPRER